MVKSSSINLLKDQNKKWWEITIAVLMIKLMNLSLSLWITSVWIPSSAERASNLTLSLQGNLLEEICSKKSLRLI